MASPADNTGRQCFQIGTSSDETSATFSVSSSDKAVEPGGPEVVIVLQPESQGTRPPMSGGSPANALPVRQVRANSAPNGSKNEEPAHQSRGTEGRATTPGARKTGARRTRGSRSPGVPAATTTTTTTKNRTDPTAQCGDHLHATLSRSDSRPGGQSKPERLLTKCEKEFWANKPN